MTNTDFAYWMAKIQEHFIAVFTFDLGRYIIAASSLAVLIWLFRGWSEARRIQGRRAKAADYWREISSSLRTVFFFGVTGLTTLLMVEAGIISVHEGSYGVLAFAVQLVVLIVAHDAHFYWMHRALHTKRLFRATHLHHHKSRTPTVWAAYSFSAWEAMAEAGFLPLFLLVTSLMGIEVIDFAIFIFLAWMILRNVIGHAGVEVHPAGWVDNKALDWLTTTTHHDLHHSEGAHNFGLYFTWWDRWMGTEHPEYKARFRAVAKPIRFPVRAAGQAAVVAMAVFAATSTTSGWIFAVEAGMA